MMRYIGVRWTIDNVDPRGFDIAICSPLWPKRLELGRTGAHFAGFDSRALPGRCFDRPATKWVDENWRQHRTELCRRTGLDIPP